MGDAILQERARAITEEQMYQEPASTKALIDALADALDARDAEIARQRRRATNAEYMAEAYRQMLGPKARSVADTWEAQGLVRQHSSWSVDPYSLDGEEIAEIHAQWMEAAKSAEPIGDVDAAIRALAKGKE